MVSNNFKVILKSTFYPSSIINFFFFLTEITISYKHGLPLITLTLPSRKERCQFVVKPMLSTVGSFLQDLQNEDTGIRTAAIFTAGVYVYISSFVFFLFFWTFVLFLYFLQNYYIINGWSLLSPSFLNMSDVKKKMNSNGEKRNGSLIHVLVIYFINLAPRFFWENFNDIVIGI